MTFRERIAAAYHERWCGTPPSCVVSSFTDSPCEGKLDRASLDALVGGALRKGGIMMADTSHLIVRRDGVLCTVCHVTEPVHAGESGNPMPAMLIGYDGVARRHPRKKHLDPWAKRSDKKQPGGAK